MCASASTRDIIMGTIKRKTITQTNVVDDRTAENAPTHATIVETDVIKKSLRTDDIVAAASKINE